MCFRFRSFPFRSVPFRSLIFRFWLLSLCFFLSSFFPFPPLSCFSGAASPLSLPCFSPFFPTWFPVSSFPVLRTRLSVCFLSSLPASLPQLFHRCFPYALAFGLSPFLLLSFVCICSGSNYSAFRSFLSLSSPLCLTVAFRMLPFSLSASRLFHFRSARFPVLRFYFQVLGFL